MTIVLNSPHTQPSAQIVELGSTPKSDFRPTPADFGDNSDYAVSISADTQDFFEHLSKFSNDTRISIYIDGASGRPVVKIMSADGSAAILQIPSELSLRLSKSLPGTVGVLADTLT